MITAENATALAAVSPRSQRSLRRASQRGTPSPVLTSGSVASRPRADVQLSAVPPHLARLRACSEGTKHPIVGYIEREQKDNTRVWEEIPCVF
jgi:hypothetical protein